MKLNKIIKITAVVYFMFGINAFAESHEQVALPKVKNAKSHDAVQSNINNYEYKKVLSPEIKEEQYVDKHMEK